MSQIQAASWQTGKSMNKEKLEKRLVELEAQLRQIENNGNAVIGAIQECQYWLAQIEQSKNAPKKTEKPVEKK
jgi:hypothetical protein